MAELAEIYKSVLEGNVTDAVEKTKAAIRENLAAKYILDRALFPAITKVGDLFQKGEYFFPDLLTSGEAMKASLDILKPELSRRKVPTVGHFLIGTVKYDLHDIGKNIVIMFLQANGWEVTDLGIDRPPEAFCEAVKNGSFDVLGLSALLTLSMPWQGKTIEVLKEAGLRDKVKVMVGGVSVTQQWADKIGADAFGKDAIDAVKKANQLVGKSLGG